MSNERLYKRINDLLRMAADASSPNEAAIAARRARKLLDENQLSEQEVVLQDMKSGEKMVEEIHKTPRMRANAWRGVMSLAVARLNDCNCRYRARVDSDGIKRLSIVFQGYQQDAEFSLWLFETLLETVERCLKVERSRFPHWKKLEMTRFRYGFSCGVADQVQEILKQRNSEQPTTGTALIVVKKQLVEKHFGRQPEKRTKLASGGYDAYNNGVEHGRAASLNRGVTQQTTRQLT